MYTKAFSLKSHDYSLDHREDELIWEFHSQETFDLTVNAGGNGTGDKAVKTNLDEIVGLIPLFDMDTFETGDYIDDLQTNGVVSSGAVTIRINTVSIGTPGGSGKITTSFFLLGKRKRKDV